MRRAVLGALPEFDVFPIGKNIGWSGELSAAVMFGSRGYHGYYYSVSQRYAEAGRPAYSAPGGYSGQHYALILKRYFGRIWVIPFFRYDNLSGVAFKDSPLYKRRDYFLFGMGCALILSER